jgi:hypothetical protein
MAGLALEQKNRGGKRRRLEQGEGSCLDDSVVKAHTGGIPAAVEATPSPVVRSGQYGTRHTPLQSAKPQLPPNVVDIDAADEHFDAHYARSIHALMRSKETELLIEAPHCIFKAPKSSVYGLSANTLSSSSSSSSSSSGGGGGGVPSSGQTKQFQTVITESVRNAMVDYMTCLAGHGHTSALDLSDNTLHLGVELLDAMVCRKTMNRQMFYLMAAACLMVAGKCHEIYAPTSEDLARFMSTKDRVVQKEDVQKSEETILEMLDYQVLWPTRVFFVERFLRAGCMSHREASMVHYFADLSLQDFSLGKWECSRVAAAAVHLARQMCRSRSELLWSASLQYHTGYTEDDLFECICGLAQAHAFTKTDTHVFMKYSDEAHHCVATYAVSAFQTRGLAALRFDDPGFSPLHPLSHAAQSGSIRPKQGSY